MPFTSDKDNFSFSLPKPGSIGKFFLTILGILFSLSLVVTPVYPASTSSSPIKVSIAGQSTSTIAANRAILTLKITSSGNSQLKVADEVRLATEDVLGLLRPHSTHHPATHYDWEPIVELSVNTFSSNARKKGGFLGEKDVFEANAEVSATFDAHDDRPEAIMYPKGFETLSTVLAKVTKTSGVRVESLKWTLDEQTKKHVLAQVRTAAMQEAVDKVRAYAKPLLGENPMVRATSFREGWRAARGEDDLVMMDMLDVDDGRVAARDEMNGEGGEEDELESIGMEPRVLEARADVEGDFEVWIPASEASRGSFLGWLRWCYVEFSALGAKVVLRR